jgi:hypothetical protein
MTAPVVITSAITIELPYPGGEISKNHMWNGGDRKKGLTKTAEEWKTTLVAWLQHFPFFHMSAYLVLPVTVEIGARFRDGNHRLDMHNLGELVCDAVQEGIGVDDKHFEVLTRQPEMGAAEPVVLVTVRVRMEV